MAKPFCLRHLTGQLGKAGFNRASEAEESPCQAVSEKWQFNVTSSGTEESLISNRDINLSPPSRWRRQPE